MGCEPHSFRNGEEMSKKDEVIYHLAYRINRGPQQHIYALKKICEKKKKKLLEEHGEKIKFSRLERA
tara:strand:+ start:2367 stop:2567 length:201 start_codon:yes stop_codon:yes gene_type:complete